MTTVKFGNNLPISPMVETANQHLATINYNRRLFQKDNIRNLANAVESLSEGLNRVSQQLDTKA